MGLNPTASSTQVTRIRLAATVCKTVLFGVNIAGSNPAACTSLTCPENGQLLRGSRKGGRRAHNPETRIVTGDRNQSSGQVRFCALPGGPASWTRADYDEK